MGYSNTEQNVAVADAEARSKITKWVGEQLGARVISLERERRWRPIWRVRYEKEGKEAGLIIKGMRPFEAIPFSLGHEMLSQQMLEENGFPVPHVFGKLDDLNFVMEFVEGEKDPGLVQQADEATSEMSPERWQTCHEFMEWLVKLHGMPVEKMAHTEATIPTTPTEIALNLAERYYKMICERDAVDAVTEYFIRWMRRYVPQHRTRPAIVLGDGGQFMTDGAKLTAIIDVELAHVGDPYNDFAPLRCRHPLENFGDIPALFRHYEKISGEPLDWKAIAYSTVVYSGWGMTAYTMALKEPHVGGDWAEIVSARAFIMRRTLDAIADYMGITYNDEIELPAPRSTPIEDSGLQKLILELKLLPISPALMEWQRDNLANIPAMLLNQAHYGEWVDREFVADVERLTGSSFSDAQAADRALRGFVESAGENEDETLARLFHRHAYRLCLMVAGEGAGKDHVMFARIEPILDKNGKPG